MHHNPIDIKNLNYAYADGTQALQEINLSICASEKVAIVGANGSGKSTFLQHLNGILLPQTGEIVIGEMSVEPKHLKAIRNFVGLVFQNPDDQIFMPTVWEDITFGVMNQGWRGHDLNHRARHAMAAVGLDPDRFGGRIASNLSGGEKNGWRSPEFLPCSPKFWC